MFVLFFTFFFFKQKTAYEMRISDWSSDVCSSDLFSEHDGLRSVEQYPILKMILNRPRKHASLDVPAFANQIFGRIGMGDSFHILMDNRSLIEIRCHIMCRCSEHFYAPLMGLVLGFCPLATRPAADMVCDATGRAED